MKLMITHDNVMMYMKENFEPAERADGKIVINKEQMDELYDVFGKDCFKTITG